MQALDTDIGRLLLHYYHALLEKFGPRSWWPAETPFEVCVGAVLTQNTAWKNVVKAIDNLKESGMLNPLTLSGTPLDRIADVIRPSGYYNVKAKRLRNFVDHLVEEYEGDLDRLFSLPAGELRMELLSINGVGKETADSIILYAACKPIFVVDAYTRRLVFRHGLMEEPTDYDAIQDFFHRNLPREVDLFNDFHAQIVAVGHHYCRKTPRCAECPLNRFPGDAGAKQGNMNILRNFGSKWSLA
ncbi:MAG: endonuclease III domain-containing protein [Pseudomonadota bacterium]